MTTIRAALVAAITTATLGLTAAHAAAPEADPKPHPKPLRPCLTEADVNRACVWDAKHMGNGIGESFIQMPKSGRIIYISHGDAHRLLRWSK